MLIVDQSTKNGHGPVLAETSREYGEEGLAGTSCPCVELLLLKPQLLGRKLRKLPLAM
jgi:hypothetical protein